jgi:hypothetical protein
MSRNASADMISLIRQGDSATAHGSCQQGVVFSLPGTPVRTTVPERPSSLRSAVRFRRSSETQGTDEVSLSYEGLLRVHRPPGVALPFGR